MTGAGGTGSSGARRRAVHPSIHPSIHNTHTHLKDLRRQVLQDRRQVHGGTSAQAGRVLALLQVAVDAGDREREPGTLRAANAFAIAPDAAAAALATHNLCAFAGHLESCCC